MPAIIFAIIFGILSTTAIVAEKSLPGDSLYSVKVSMNEPVAGIFSFSKEEKLEWKERLIERRLEEIHKLVSSNKLDESSRADIEVEIKNEVEEFIKILEEVIAKKDEANESSNLNLRLQAALKAYHQNIENTVIDSSEISDITKAQTGFLLATINDLYTRVDGEHKHLESILGSNYGKVENALTSAEKKTVAINLLNQTKILYQKERINLSITTQKIVEKNLIDSETSIKDGETFVTASDFSKAGERFQNSIKLSNDATFLIFLNNAQQDLGDSEEDNSSFFDGSEIESEEKELEKSLNESLESLDDDLSNLGLDDI